MRPVFENEGWSVDNRERWDELSEKHMETPIEKDTGESSGLGFQCDVCRLLESDP